MCSEGKAREGSSIVVTMDDVRVIKKFCEKDQASFMNEALNNDEVCLKHNSQSFNS